jgi:molybdate transport repressor ModE-like protein
VTLATTGGKGGGGVTLTTFGESLITSYRELELDIASAAARRLPAIARAVALESRSSAMTAPRPLVKH